MHLCIKNPVGKLEIVVEGLEAKKKYRWQQCKTRQFLHLGIIPLVTPPPPRNCLALKVVVFLPIILLRFLKRVKMNHGNSLV
jgi:hypothetical protein